MAESHGFKACEVFFSFFSHVSRGGGYPKLLCSYCMTGGRKIAESVADASHLFSGGAGSNVQSHLLKYTIANVFTSAVGWTYASLPPIHSST